MLSRPSRDESRCFGMLAAKACSPCRDSNLLPRGTHAFAAGRAQASALFSEGRESMAPPGVKRIHQEPAKDRLPAYPYAAGSPTAFFLLQ